jgi:hypothetical protein
VAQVVDFVEADSAGFVLVQADLAVADRFAAVSAIYRRR